MALPATVSDPGAQRNFDALAGLIFYGHGTPEGVVAAKIGATYHRLDGGASTSFYVKESSSGQKTGWVAK